MELRTSADFRSISYPRPPRLRCPECAGFGYTTMDTTENVTLWDNDYPVTVSVTCYRTRTCWRCHGRGLVREEE